VHILSVFISKLKIKIKSYFEQREIWNLLCLFAAPTVAILNRDNYDSGNYFNINNYLKDKKNKLIVLVSSNIILVQMLSI